MMRPCYARIIVAAAILLAGCSSPQYCWEAEPVAPVSVTLADIYEDGGTAVVVFTDARGCEYQVCLDGRESPSDFPRCLYINARYPTDAEARKLDPGKALGSAVHSVLEDWLVRQLTTEERRILRESKTVVGLSDDEVLALRVLAVVRGFRSGVCSERAASN